MLENHALKIFLANKENNLSLVYDFSLKIQSNKPVVILEESLMVIKVGHL
jgi:hypothetical protein